MFCSNWLSEATKFASIKIRQIIKAFRLGTYNFIPAPSAQSAIGQPQAVNFIEFRFVDLVQMVHPPSPPYRSSILHPNSRAITGSISARGLDLPVSHIVTVARFTLSAAASCSCVMSAFILRSRIIISSPPLHFVIILYISFCSMSIFFTMFCSNLFLQAHFVIKSP